MTRRSPSGLPAEEEPRRVLLVEDEAMARTLLTGVLVASGFEVHACASAAEASKAFAAFDPDALVCDIDLGEGPSGLDLVASLTRRATWLAVVVISNYVITPDYRQAGLGRAAYISKRDFRDTAVLLDTLEAVLHDHGPRGGPAESSAGRLSVLTASQTQVLRMIAEGLSNEEIAHRRGISTKSIEHMVGRILVALGLGASPSVNSRVLAARLYIEEAGRSSSHPE